jgi:L-fuculose-phosphate aldolase
VNEVELRRDLVKYSRDCIARGLSNATAGNISVRFENGMLITPSGIEPFDMREEQIAAVTFDGASIGPLKPSSEWALHATLYRRRPEVQAVVHAHPVHCVALSALQKPIPSFHYMVAGFGGDEIPCAPYEVFGSQALADVVSSTIGQSYHSCLMANHGMIALGPDLKTAMSRTEKLETLARQYQLAKSVGDPILLTAAEMATVREAYATYGYGSTGSKPSG